MPGSDDLAGLNTKDWDKLQDLADSLEEAWKGGASVDLARFLPPPGDAARRTVLLELIKTDLGCRWRHGQAVVLDYYLEKFPQDLGPPASLPPRLVFEEYRVRHIAGDRPPLTQFKARFPNQFEEVQNLVQRHSWPERVDTPSANSPTRQEPASTPPAPSVDKALSLSKEQVLSQVGGIILLERIGTGGFAEVWKVKAPGGFLKAMKVIIRPIDQTDAQREIEAMDLIKNLRHHFLLTTHSYWPFDDRLYILMDLADCSLRDLLNKYKKEGKPAIPLPELLGYFQQTAEALDYLHSRKVQHRDIKPENILLTEGNVRVADFGLAKAQGTRRMMTCSFAGTPLYMPPEAWNDKAHMHGDQYSFAATYYELRTGRRMFKDSGGLPSLMNSHLHETPELKGISEAEQQVVLKALSKNPDDRYPTCVAFVRALKKSVFDELPPDSAMAGFLPIEGSVRTQIDPNMNTLAPGGRVKPSWATPDTQPQAPSFDRSAAPAQGRSRFGVFLLVALFLGLVGALGWMVVAPLLNPQPPPHAGDFTLDPLSPMSIHAGEAEPVSIHIQRDRFTAPVVLTFSGDSDIQIGEETIAADATSAQVKVQVADAATPGPRRIKVEAVSGDKRAEGVFDLTVKPLATLPPPASGRKFRPMGTKIVHLKNGKKYYKHIETSAGDKPVRFVFIPWEEEAKSFYIMVDKVHNTLFAQFAKENPGAVRDDRWRLGARLDLDNDWFWEPEALSYLYALASAPWNPNLLRPFVEKHSYSLPHPGDLGIKNGDLPVMRVDIIDAQNFARWLGGFLPAVDEWDKAAGHCPHLKEGASTSGFQAGDFGVGRAKLGPLPVGAALKDKCGKDGSGCNDMAGNGLEWTRSYKGTKTGEYRVDAAKVPASARMFLRGWDYADPQPLRAEDLAEGGRTFHFYEAMRDSENRWMLCHIGFRVVILVGS